MRRLSLVTLLVLTGCATRMTQEEVAALRADTDRQLAEIEAEYVPRYLDEQDAHQERYDAAFEDWRIRFVEAMKGFPQGVGRSRAIWEWQQANPQPTWQSTY